MHRSSSSVRSVLIALPPDGGYAWVIVFASFMINVVIDGIIYSFGKTMVVLSKDINTSMSQMSIVGSLQQGLYYLIGPITSAFVNRFGFRIVVFCGAVITCIGILAASFISSYIGLLCCYGLLAGIGFGIMFPPSIIIIGYNFEKYRAISTGLGLSGSSVGVLALAPLFNYITDHYNWRVTFQVQSAFLLVCMISAMAYRPLKPVKVTVSEESSIRSSSGSSIDFVQLYNSSSKGAKNAATKYISKKHFQTSVETTKIVKNMNESKESETCYGCCSCCRLLKKRPKDNIITTGPLDRKDIFYSGNLKLLPEYKADRAKMNKETAKMPINYHLSMIHESEDTLDDVDDKRCCRCNISHMIKNAMALLFDVSILKSEAFLTFALSNFCYVFALYVPYMFIKKRADLNHISEEYSSYFISSIATGNFVGRVTSGVIGSVLTKIHYCYLIGFPSMIAGTITIISAFVLEDNIYFQFVFCVIMGYFSAFMVTLRPIVIVYLLGLKKLTNGFGLNMMTMGFSGLIGVPIATAISQASGNYTYAFLMTGCFFVTSGALMIAALHIHKYKQRTIKN